LALLNTAVFAMLILHPQSTCDICAERYSTGNAPYTITCGHIFCLSCLQSLDIPTRCPMCRCDFLMENVRKLHIDTPTCVDRGREFTSRITRTVIDGGSAEDVSCLLKEVRSWLDGSEEEFADLRASYILLHNLTDTHRKYKDEVAHTQRLSDKLKEQREELKEQRRRYERMDQEWSENYDACFLSYVELQEEMRTKHRSSPSVMLRDMLNRESLAKMLLHSDHWQFYKSPRRIEKTIFGYHDRKTPVKESLSRHTTTDGKSLSFSSKQESTQSTCHRTHWTS